MDSSTVGQENFLSAPPELAPEAKMTYPDDHDYDTSNLDARMEMPQEEIDAIIRNKRKARDPKACYACHRRKVKCDRKQPCDSCIKRDHPELCSYERPGKKRRLGLAPTVVNHRPSDGAEYAPQQDGDTVTVSREHWDQINHELQMLRDGPGPHQTLDSAIDTRLRQDDVDAPSQNPSDESEREGIHAQSNQMGTMHLGSRSVLAYMMGLGRSRSTQDAAKNLLEENVLPKLGLDNETATYPFVDLWSTDNTMQDVSGLCRALPDDRLCKTFFEAYRDVACTIYPVVPDASSFEETLDFFLANRAQVAGDMSSIDPNRPFGVEISWLALLFAVLASGSQSSRQTAKERELTSQVYTCCAYQALRMANFLTHPSLNAIQAFLIVGNVLSYNMNPGVSYIFLGLTIRMAFSIGLQADSQKFSPSEQFTRQRIWWALAWQDSHFAVSYDRPTSSVFCSPSIPYKKTSTPGYRSYAESMFRIIKLTQEIIRDRTLNPRQTMTWANIVSYKEEVARIVADGAAHLRERARCVLMTQHLERLALKLHASYITSELCRPALKEPTQLGNAYNTPLSANGTPIHSPTNATNGQRRGSHSQHSPKSSISSSHESQVSMIMRLRQDCITSLENTVDAYVELHSLSEFAARSWIGIQRSISAAFLLGTTPEVTRSPRTHKILRDLENVIAQRTVEDPAFTEGAASPPTRRKSSAEQVPLAESPHWARSMTRSLQALGKMNKALNAGPGHTMPPLQPRPEVHSVHPQQPVQSLSPSHGDRNAPYASQHLGAYNVPPLGPVAISGGLAMPTSSPQHAFVGTSAIPNLNSESFSPGGVGNMNPITPDSTGSASDWNYGNMPERALEFVSPALWG